MIKPSIQYIAGFFDGEGGVGISAARTFRKEKHPNSGKSVDHVKWRCIAYITNTDRACLELIRSVIGGNISQTRKQLGKSRRCFRINLLGHYAKEFLESVLPWLIIKHERAELALAFLQTLAPNSPRKGEHHKNKQVPYQTQVLRYEMYRRMLLLNGRGIQTAKPGKFVLPPPRPSKYISCKLCDAPIRRHQGAKRPRRNYVCKHCWLTTMAGRGKKSRWTPERRAIANISSKKGAIMSLMRRANGATLIELVTLTGWKIDVVRSYVTSMFRSKMKLDVESFINADGQRTYKLSE